MRVFLTSDMQMSVKKNGERIACEINNINGIVDQLKILIKKFNKFVFIASNPDGYEKTDSYANVTKKSFELSGMFFNEFIVLDNRNAKNTKQIIKNADIIYLAGGYVPTQNSFFEKIKLKQCLKKFDGVIIGQSAGAMNLSNIVYNYPEDETELNDPKYLTGLGLSPITIIPHYEKNTGNIHSQGMNILQDYFLPDSKDNTFIAITDGSHVLIEEGKVLLCGEIYEIKDGVITELCYEGIQCFYE